MRALIFTLCFFSVTAVAAKNGFDLSNSIIPKHEIKAGGPPRDGIVALSNPKFVQVGDVKLKGDDRVLGVVIGKQAKAYPIRYLNIHEIVNDQIDQQYYAVTFCPLCGSGVVFATNISSTSDRGALNFGVSGLLYNSDLLMYDRNTQSLWSQLEGQAVAGKLVGTKLNLIPVLHTTWQDWQQQHPATQVMAGHPKFNRLYRRNPYPGYAKSKRLKFSVNHKAPNTYHPKEWVLGVTINGESKAYPFVELFSLPKEMSSIDDQLAGQNIQVQWDRDSRSAWVVDEQGETIVSTVSFWFAWYTFNPQTLVYSAAP